MRHGRKVNHLSRKAGHRKALMRNMASSLLISEKKRIITTLAKAKALRKYVEPLITKAKTNTTHSRRVAFTYLQNKEAVKELFGTVASKVGDRPGGYTRILKIGPRLGDNAEMALIELVDFNEFIQDAPKKKSSRRRKKSKKPAEKAAPKAEAPVEEVVEEVVEETVEETVEEVVDEVTETPSDEVETTDEPVAEADSEDAVSEDSAGEEEE